MPYMTRRSHQMQKHKFGITYPGEFFVKSVPVPPEHKKYCVTVSHPEWTGMQYVTHRSCRMQKHNFGVMCPSTLFMETALSPPEHEK
jgi:hypothetical protein